MDQRRPLPQRTRGNRPPCLWPLLTSAPVWKGLGWRERDYPRISSPMSIASDRQCTGSQSPRRLPSRLSGVYILGARAQIRDSLQTLVAGRRMSATCI